MLLIVLALLLLALLFGPALFGQAILARLGGGGSSGYRVTAATVGGPLWSPTVSGLRVTGPGADVQAGTVRPRRARIVVQAAATPC